MQNNPTVQVVPAADCKHIPEVAELDVSVLLVTLQLYGVDNWVVSVRWFVEDQFGFFLDGAPD